MFSRHKTKKGSFTKKKIFSIAIFLRILTFNARILWQNEAVYIKMSPCCNVGTTQEVAFGKLNQQGVRFQTCAQYKRICINFKGNQYSLEYKVG
jgi:hypothetical protein